MGTEEINTSKASNKLVSYAPAHQQQPQTDYKQRTIKLRMRLVRLQKDTSSHSQIAEQVNSPSYKDCTVQEQAKEPKTG